MNNLENKIIVITGGASGIGYEIADKYIQKGTKTVVILDINEDQGSKAVQKLNSKYGIGKVVFYKCDVTKELDAMYKQLKEQYQSIDVLVNSAGIGVEENITKIVDLNLRALIEWTLKFWNHMRTDEGGKGGTIVNISSIYGYIIDPFVPVYKATKFGVSGFSKSLGHTSNYNRSGVRVVAICPGFTETELVNQVVQWDKKMNAEYSKFLENEDLWQKPDAVGDAAVEVFEKAKSGTAWVIENSKPIFEV